MWSSDKARKAEYCQHIDLTFKTKIIKCPIISPSVPEGVKWDSTLEAKIVLNDLNIWLLNIKPTYQDNRS